MTPGTILNSKRTHSLAPGDASCRSMSATWATNGQHHPAQVIVGCEVDGRPFVEEA
jgi:hypothetical protein